MVLKIRYKHGLVPGSPEVLYECFHLLGLLCHRPRFSDSSSQPRASPWIYLVGLDDLSGATSRQVRSPSSLSASSTRSLLHSVLCLSCSPPSEWIRAGLFLLRSPIVPRLYGACFHVYILSLIHLGQQHFMPDP